MKKLICCCVFLLLIVTLPAAAIDVSLRDGTVISAESYTITGSFIMLKMADGRKVGYAIEDVNMESLEQPEPEAPEAEPGDPEAVSRAFGGALKLAEGGESVLTLTDDDVDHIEAGEVVEGAAEEAEEPQSAAGAVVLEDIRMDGVDGQYVVQGRVANQTGGKVLNVRVALTARGGAGQTLGSGEVVASSSLEDGEKAVFTHRFVLESNEPPRVSAKIVWMQVGAPRPKTEPEAE